MCAAPHNLLSDFSTDIPITVNIELLKAEEYSYYIYHSKQIKTAHHFKSGVKRSTY